MNERIRELRKQAINFCLDKGSQGNLSEEVSEKFAELIIRECAVLVEEFTYLEEMGLDDYKEITGKEMILSTFGVK